MFRIKVISTIYRQKVNFLILGIVSMTLLLGYRFLKLDETNPNNRHFRNKHQSIEISGDGDSKRGQDSDLIKHLIFKNKQIIEKRFEQNQKKLLNNQDEVGLADTEKNTRKREKKQQFEKIDEDNNQNENNNNKLIIKDNSYLNKEKNNLNINIDNDRKIANGLININNNLNNLNNLNNRQLPQGFENIPAINIKPINRGNGNNYGEPIFNGKNEDYLEGEKWIKKNLDELERVVHVDLKGAPPKIDYFRTFIPLLRKYGATGILLEYEDVFPFDGQLADARHGHAYTLEDVRLIKRLAKENNLYIIPLIQTYGHMEWVLKLKKFAHLRDTAEFPQVITQCLEESYTLIFDMLDQVLKQHEDAPYVHIGCDEVYYKLMHPSCNNQTYRNDFTEAFMIHLIRLSKYIRKKMPKTKILFWDDMLHNMDEFVLMKFKPDIKKLEIEPMIWAYVENVADWFQPMLYMKYGKVFENVWAASAYKGASGELTTVTSIQHHYLNHISWIEVILEKHKSQTVKFKGIALTGWSRYDHFLALCDLLPQSVPSLVYNLQAVVHGKLNPDKRVEISNQLGCSSSLPWTPEEIYDNYITCDFPGHEVYEAVLPINNLIKNLEPNLDFAKKYMTPLNLNYNYVHKARAYEVLEKLNYDYVALNRFKNRFINAAQIIYRNDTIIEWLTVYLIPHLDPLYDLIQKTKEVMKENSWMPRPLPVTLRQYPEFI